MRRLKTVRRPPIYPKTPGHLPYSLTHPLPLSSRRPSVSFGGFGFTGIVYSREINGRTHNFGVSGKLIMNALVMYDQETESYWSQFLGQAVEGELNGTRLELIPSQLILYGEWREQHPDTLVLDKGRPGATSDSYASYYFSNSAGIIGETNVDDRLFTKSLVIGLEGRSSQKAYAYQTLVQSGPINDVFDDTPLIVALNEDGGSSTVYDRRVDGQTLTFKDTDDPRYLEDMETGSKWEKVSGLGVEGPMAGKQLDPVRFVASFWFAWTDFFPDTELFPVDGE